MIIGQTELLSYFETHSLAPLTILVGSAGSGKNIIAREIAKRAFLYELPDVRVETTRKMIADAYSMTAPFVFLIPDADGMSSAGMNALLKLTEEPPTNASIIMTLEQTENTLATILSRAQVFQLAPYSKEELMQFIPADTPEELKKLVPKICETPGDVLQILEVGIDMWSFADKVVEHVATASGGNALKISEQLALKNETDKYDFRLFLQMVRANCLARALNTEDVDEQEKYLTGVVLTSRIVSKLRTLGISKQFLFDKWLFEIREAWR